jgi:hypothetical protein
MSLTPTQREVYDYCSTNEFVPAHKIQEFSERLNAEGNLSTLSYALEKFRSDRCPNCNAEGAFKWHFMGQHKHPSCGHSWYTAPGTYSAEQLKAVFRSGASAGASISSEADKKNDKAGGCMGAIFGFFFVAIFRLFFAVIMIPIQAIVSLTQSKSKKSENP